MIIPKKSPKAKPAILVTEKYTRYRLAHKRGNFRPTGFVGSPKGKVVYLYEYPDRLSLAELTYVVINGKMVTAGLKKFVLKEKNGRFNFYRISKNSIRNYSNYIHAFSVSMGVKKYETHLRKFLRRKKVYRKHKTDNYKTAILGVLYPALVDLKGFCPEAKVGTISSDYSICLKEPTFRKAVKKCFGVAGDAMFKAVCEKVKKKSSLDCFLIGMTLRNILSPNDLLKLVANFSTDIRYGYKTKELRKFCRLFNNDRLKILAAGNDLFSIYAIDAAKMYFEYKDKGVILPEKPKSFREIHDFLVKQVNKIKTGFKELSQEKLKKLDNVQVGDMTIVIPKSNHELLDWGNAMSNCIGGYWYNVQSGDTNVFGIVKNGDLTYNVEVYRGAIRQFVGKRNQPAPPEDYGLIEKLLKKEGIIYT